MALFVLVHGAYHGGWCWQHLGEELERSGHRWVAPDLPCDQPVGISGYVDTVVEAVRSTPPGDGEDVVVVGHSLGGLTAPVVADVLGAQRLVLLAATVPEPGRPAVGATHPTEVGEFWQARTDRQVVNGELSGWPDAEARDIFFHDCSDEVATWAVSQLRLQHFGLLGEPCPLATWPTSDVTYIACRDDRTITFRWQQAAAARLGVEPVVLAGGHSPFLARPKELADVLTAGT